MVCLAKVVLEMGPRSPLPSGRSAAKARPTKLGNLVTGPLSIAPASRSCGVQNTEYHLTLPWRHAMHRRAAGSSTARSKGQDKELPHAVGGTRTKKGTYTVGTVQNL